MIRFLPATLAGAIVIVATLAFAIVAAVHHRNAPPPIAAAWIAVGTLIPIAALIAAFVRFHGGRLARVFARTRPLLVGLPLLALLAGAGWLAAVDHRRYAVLLGLIQTVVFWRLSRGRNRSTLTLLAIGAVSIAAWCATVGIAFTAFQNVLTGTNALSALAAVAFALALPLFVADALTDESPGPTHARKRSVRLAGMGAVIALFAWCALRTDGLTRDWIPYHRDFFTAPAELIRQGGLPLWDVPSQYGVLSEIVLALVPTHDVWQGLYLLTAAFLVVQATIVFAIMRSGKTGAIATLAAGLAACAAFFTSAASRYPFGARLYPQGGMRFIWLYLLIAVAVRIYLDPARARPMRRLGFVLWAVGMLWSLESAVWSTLVWGGFIVAEAAIAASTARRANVRVAAARIAPILIVPIVAAGMLTLAYSVFAHHRVDWFGFIEYGIAFGGNAEYGHLFAATGPVWVFPFFLAAPAALGIIAIRTGRTKPLPLLVAAWFVVWATASYYVGEPFPDHVNLLAGNLVLTAAVVSLAARRERFAAPFAAVQAAGMIPLLVVLVTSGSGEARDLLRGPYASAYPFDASRAMPTVPAELALLERRAGIDPTDRALFPSSPNWATFGEGMISPFVIDARGVRHEQTGWFLDDQPGMINQLLELPPARRAVYRERFLDRTRASGWLLTYGADPACSQLSPRLRNSRIVRTANFAATYCRFVAYTTTAGRSR